MPASCIVLAAPCIACTYINAVNALPGQHHAWTRLALLRGWINAGDAAKAVSRWTVATAVCRTGAAHASNNIGESAQVSHVSLCLLNSFVQGWTGGMRIPCRHASICTPQERVVVLSSCSLASTGSASCMALIVPGAVAICPCPAHHVLDIGRCVHQNHGTPAVDKPWSDCESNLAR